VLCHEDGMVAAMIDFGDAVYTEVINDAAICLAYAMMGKPDPLAAAGAFLRGYHAEYPLLAAEKLEVLHVLILARLAVSVTKCARGMREDPSNAEYLEISNAPAWALIRKLLEIDPAEATSSFKKVMTQEASPGEEEVESPVSPLTPASTTSPKIEALKGDVKAIDSELHAHNKQVLESRGPARKEIKKKVTEIEDEKTNKLAALKEEQEEEFKRQTSPQSSPQQEGTTELSKEIKADLARNEEAATAKEIPKELPEPDKGSNSGGWFGWVSCGGCGRNV